MLEDPKDLSTSPLHEGLCMGLGQQRQQGARNKPKIGDNLQTRSPGLDPGDMGQW